MCGKPYLVISSRSLIAGMQATSSRSGARLNFLRANSQLSGQEQAAESFLRSNAPARFTQYEALQAAAEASWRQSAASDAAVAAVAKVRPRQHPCHHK